jgi:hypothetical protein
MMNVRHEWRGKYIMMKAHSVRYDEWRGKYIMVKAHSRWAIRQVTTSENFLSPIITAMGDEWRGKYIM